MASHADDSDDGMDEFMEKFKKEKYKNGFNESNWEEEFDRVPMFMKKAPEVIDPQVHPELACINSIIHDDDRSPEEQALSFKDEGNAYFKEKDYKKAIVSYTEGLKKKSGDSEVNAILYTNRAAAHFHLGNMRSSLTDAAAAKKVKPDHIKALIRGAQCCLELKKYSDALLWCEEGLRLQPIDKKLQELRKTADNKKRAAERDARKAKFKEKKMDAQKEALLAAIRGRGIKLLQQLPGDPEKDPEVEEEYDPYAALAGLEMRLETRGVMVSMDDQGCLNWPVLFLYPEYQQTDLVASFHENSCFIDHIAVMFGEELPSWDHETKYRPHNLMLFFEDVVTEAMYEVDMRSTLLEVLQHKRYTVRGGSPGFMIFVRGSAFFKKFFKGMKTQFL